MTHKKGIMLNRKLQRNFLLQKTPNLNGRIRLSIVDTYYDKAKKCSRQKTIESIDWLDKLEKQYDDPIAHFQKRVEQLKAEKAGRWETGCFLEWKICQTSKKLRWQKPTILLHLAELSFTLIFIGQVRFYTVQYIHKLTYNIFIRIS